MNIKLKLFVTVFPAHKHIRTVWVWKQKALHVWPHRRWCHVAAPSLHTPWDRLNIYWLQEDRVWHQHPESASHDQHHPGRRHWGKEQQTWRARAGWRCEADVAHGEGGTHINTDMRDQTLMNTDQVHLRSLQRHEHEATSGRQRRRHSKSGLELSQPLCSCNVVADIWAVGQYRLDIFSSHGRRKIVAAPEVYSLWDTKALGLLYRFHGT